MQLTENSTCNPIAANRLSICWGWCHWLTCLTVIVVGRQLGQWVGQDRSSAPVVEARFVVDVNTAELRELQALPEVGPALAGRIVAHRRAHGPFADVEQLLDVTGVGPRTLAQLRPMLTVSTGNPATPPEN